MLQRLINSTHPQQNLFVCFLRLFPKVLLSRQLRLAGLGRMILSLPQPSKCLSHGHTPLCRLQDRFFLHTFSFHHGYPYDRPLPLLQRPQRQSVFSSNPAYLTRVFGFAPKSSAPTTHTSTPQRKASEENELDLLPRAVMQCVMIYIKASGQGSAQDMHHCCDYCPCCQLLFQFSPSLVLLMSSYGHNQSPCLLLH